MGKIKRNPVFPYTAKIDEHCLLVEKKLPVMSAEAQGSEFTRRTKARTNVELPNY